jgi:probable F420-dependent oxidoreductase
MSVRVDITLFGDQVSIQEMVRIASLAEDAGFGGVWTGEVWRDSLVPLAPIAAATSTVKLGTNVTQWARTPPTLAVAAGDLAELSGGRFTLGLGTAPKEWNEAWFDISYEQPVRRMREYIEALRLLWTAGPMQPVSYEGEVFTISDYIRLRGPLEEQVPIHIGLTLPGMAGLAGEIADGVNFNVLSTPEQLRGVLVPQVEAGAQRAGRSLGDMEIGTVVCTAVSADRAEAVQWAKHQIAFYSGVGSYFEPMMQRHGFGEEYNEVRGAFQAGDPMAAIGGVTDEMVETFAMAGTPDEVRGKLSRFDGVVDFVMLYPPTFLLEPDVVLAEHEAAVAAFASR